MSNNYEGFTKELRCFFIAMLSDYIGRAGEEIGTKIKPADGTPVTDLDQYTLALLREIISTHFPDDYTIGEEDQRDNAEMKRILSRQDQYQWTIDGLDGTGNLLLGINSFGAAVARRRGNDLLFAVTLLPVDEVLRGNGFIRYMQNAGTWEWCPATTKIEPGYVQLHTAPAGKLKRLTVMLEGSSKKFFRPPISNLGAAETTRPGCSSTVASIAVARGKASALVTAGNKPWDNWPSMAQILGAGGIVTDWQGNPVDLSNCGNIIAAGNAQDHARIVELLNQ